jgi:hypothetical protein
MRAWCLFVVVVDRLDCRELRLRETVGGSEKADEIEEVGVAVVEVDGLLVVGEPKVVVEDEARCFCEAAEGTGFAGFRLVPEACCSVVLDDFDDALFLRDGGHVGLLTWKIRGSCLGAGR